MRRLRTEVLVIGGGATGTGVLRDLAMRGFDTVLVEQRDLSHGTSGRYHGLLHSGGRYAVKDPEAAVECIEENRVLRRIMPHCLEDTGGYFVVTPWDDPDYIPEFLAGCRRAGIPVAEVPVSEALRREPYLNPDITHCFEVPDAAADSFLAAESLAASAREHSATVLPYHEVTSLVRKGETVVGARCHDLVTGEEVVITTDVVVNASGAWAGRVAATAGVEFSVQAGKGTMLGINHRMVNTVLNRCKMPDDGDIIVPIRTVAVIGTTDEGVPHPERFSVEPWEVRLMLEEGDKLVPGISGMRVLRAWAGVRPLYQEKAAGDTRDVTRAYALLDHADRDGVDGFVTITGGKWTTFRQMAEVTADSVCRKLGVDRPGRTHLEPLPDPRRRNGYHFLGERLARIEKEEAYGDLVCECELVTRADVTRAITDGDARTVDDIRRDVRLGMGPCQGGWCLPRVGGILHEIRRPPVAETNVALKDFLRERWKGMLPVLWGSQLRQARLDDLIFASLLRAPELPGPAASPLGPVMYEPADDETFVPTALPTSTSWGPTAPSASHDVLVVGGGPAGLMAAWQAASAGASTTLLTKGWGSLLWHAGCVDVLAVDDATVSPRQGLEEMARKGGDHPYSLVGTAAVADALDAFIQLCADDGYPLIGSLDANLVLPSGLGAARPTCLAPATMLAGDLSRSEGVLIVGLGRFGDFAPELVADNLAARGLDATPVQLELPTLDARRFVNGTVLAGLFETEAFRAEVAHALREHLTRGRRVAFPAVLGIDRATEVVADLSDRLEAEVFEVPVLPPSVPGMRLQGILRRAIRRAGGRVIDNAEAIGLEGDDDGVSVTTLAAARTQSHRARRAIIATGGILGGGVVGLADGSLREVVADLPLRGPSSRREWFDEDGAHPVYRRGVAVGPDLLARPSVLVAGGLLAGSDPIREGSLEGVALSTGWVAGREAVSR